MKKTILSLIAFFIAFACYPTNRWELTPDGGIKWNVKDDIPHSDHIEMSGLSVSTVVRYEVDKDGAFHFTRGMVWPMLRTIPNNTHASLMRKIGTDFMSPIRVNGAPIGKEKVESIELNGLMTVTSRYNYSSNNDSYIQLKRILFPSTKNPRFCEEYILTNNTKKDITIEIPTLISTSKTDPEKGVEGAYTIESRMSSGKETPFILKPGESATFYGFISARNSKIVNVDYDIAGEMEARKALISQLNGNLKLETPDPVINTLFSFSKLRGSESIYATKGGLLHGPGGESYYAAIWANDQAEYINPFFPYLGYKTGNESALNSYRHFARFTNKDYKPIPSSIIAEGTDIWNGAGDRGDAAMIAYGAARYCLTIGDKEQADELWPLIEWCLEYCKRKTNSQGVVESDTDELEGRFPAGKANLCTSSLYYDALLSASYLGKELRKSKKQTTEYAKRAEKLKLDIDKYFGGNVEGFNTYKYYEGNDVLRSWICIPLTVGIFNRSSETIKALFSPLLWTENGLLTQAGDATFWDRSTLYAMRGILAAGDSKDAMPHLKHYSNTRLLGEHVPYPIEAYPEGAQRHLSAESGLYCRIFIEGMFGIRPTSLESFDLKPVLPEEWNKMSLKNIRAFNSDFDINVERKDAKLLVSVYKGKKKVISKLINKGETVKVKI